MHLLMDHWHLSSAVDCLLCVKRFALQVTLPFTYDVTIAFNVYVLGTHMFSKSNSTPYTQRDVFTSTIICLYSPDLKWTEILSNERSHVV